VRELILTPYRLVYVVGSHEVTITMVLHQRRDISADDLK
jgi:hypothetical protein